MNHVTMSIDTALLSQSETEVIQDEPAGPEARNRKGTESGLG